MIHIDYLKYHNKILKNIDIQAGINFLRGENGSGKTLFFDELSELTKNSERKISGNTDFVYLNQHLYFNPRLIIKDFLLFIYQLNHIKSQIETFYQRIEKIGTFNVRDIIDELMNKQIGMLSGGERRFIYVMAILTLEKSWYFLDEPFIEIDKHRKEILKEMIRERVRANQNSGFIIATHEELEFSDISTKDLNFLVQEEEQNERSIEPSV